MKASFFSVLALLLNVACFSVPLARAQVNGAMPIPEREPPLEAAGCTLGGVPKQLLSDVDFRTKDCRVNFAVEGSNGKKETRSFSCLNALARVREMSASTDWTLCELRQGHTRNDNTLPFFSEISRAPQDCFQSCRAALVARSADDAYTSGSDFLNEGRCSIRRLQQNEAVHRGLLCSGVMEFASGRIRPSNSAAKSEFIRAVAPAGLSVRLSLIEKQAPALLAKNSLGASFMSRFQQCEVASDCVSSNYNFIEREGKISACRVMWGGEPVSRYFGDNPYGFVRSLTVDSGNFSTSNGCWTERFRVMPNAFDCVLNLCVRRGSAQIE